MSICDVCVGKNYYEHPKSVFTQFRTVGSDCLMLSNSEHIYELKVYSTFPHSTLPESQPKLLLGILH